MANALRNNKGFSIIEALVAMMILMVVMLGMLQTIIISADATMKSTYRDMAVKVSQEQLETMRNSVTTGDPLLLNVTSSIFTVNRQIRNTSLAFTVNRFVNVAQIAAGANNSKWVDLSITWTHKGETLSYNTSTIIRPQ